MSLAESSADSTIWGVCYFLLATTGFVLLIACVNVANLQLARAATRQQEMAMRAALGAGRGRLVRQLLTESLLLAALGGGLGLLLADWGKDLLGARITLGDVSGVRIPIDRAVLGYTLGLSVLTGLLFGIVPAWQASRLDVSQALKDGGRGTSMGRAHHLWRSLLVVAEVALALILLASAGLFLRATDRFLRLDPGFRTDHLLTFQLGLPKAKYPGGQRFSRGDPDLNDWVEIVGVVSDVRYPGDYAHSEVRPQIYESLWQRTLGGTAVALRTTVRPESLGDAARRAVAAIDPDLPLSDLVTFEHAVEREMANYLLSAQLLGGFAVFGLLLAGIGIYGVVSHSVAQRTNELGIRLALGAQPADLLRLVVRQGTGLVLVGVAAGLVGAFMVSLAIRGLLYGIGAFDLPTFGMAFAVLAAAAFLACYLPARRAARVDPVVALRNE